MKSYNQIQAAPEEGVEVRIEGETMRLFFDFKKVEMPIEEGKEKGKTQTQFEAESVDVVGGRDYGTIVSEIIRDHYSDNEIQAILANYAEVNNPASVMSLTPEKKEEYLQEYADFQMWRGHAKEIAHKVLTLI